MTTLNRPRTLDSLAYEEAMRCKSELSKDFKDFLEAARDCNKGRGNDPEAPLVSEEEAWEIAEEESARYMKIWFSCKLHQLANDTEERHAWVYDLGQVFLDRVDWYNLASQLLLAWN